MRSGKIYKAFVEFNLMSRCPNICKYCPQDVFTSTYQGDKVLGLGNFKSMLDKLPLSCISFAGFSEPFLNNDCLRMIEYAGQKGNIIIIYTTLQGMTPHIYDKLRALYRVRGLTVHLPDSEGNTKVHINQAYLEILQYIVTNPPANWCALDFSMHGKNIHPDIAHIAGSAIANSNVRHFIHDRAGYLRIDDIRVHRVNWKTGAIRCNNGFGAYPEAGIVMPDGNVYLCCMDFGLKHWLGNLHAQSWDDIMTSPIREAVRVSRETGEEGICRHCAEAGFDLDSDQETLS
jgi:radical SAM protein with 4Fe4S-binding SPASM domain